MGIEKILELILAAIIFTAIGVGLSTTAGGQHVSRHPHKHHHPGWNNLQRSKRANKARGRRFIN